MKLTTLLFTAFLLQASAKVASQNVTFSGKNVSLKQAFTSIEKQTGFVFFYAEPVLKTAKPVTVKADNVPLAEFLEEVFKSQPLRYNIRGKNIFISPKPVTPPASVADPSGTADLVPDIFGIDLRGRVVDENANPLAGASVVISGTSTGTKTDANGDFILRNVNQGDIIVISSVGYEAMRLKSTGNGIVVAGGNTGALKVHSPGNISVRLTAKAGDIEEVVVTGIFQRAEKNFTGASRTMTGTELKQVSANNVFAGITALDPSFRLVANNAAGGNINQLPNIQMRGENSLPNLSGELSNNPNNPLFILDGFEVSLQRIADLDMNMINTITLLKDASATAIYGSRGANGVMVVTTIAPKPGRLQATFTNDFRVTTPVLSVYNLLDAREKLDFEKRVGVYTASSPSSQYELDVMYNERYKEMLRGVNTDWLRIPVQTGVSNRSSVYLQGGDQSIRYGLQFMADLQSGVMKGQNRKNYSGQFDLNYLVSKFQFRNSLRVFQNVSNESPYGSFSEYVSANPYFTPYDSEGKVKQLLEPADITFGQQIANPMFDASLHSVNRTRYFGISNNFSLRYNVLRSLYLETNFSLNKQNAQTDQFYAAQDSRFNNVTDADRKGSYTARNENISSYESLTTANLNITSGRSQIFSTLGLNFSSNTNEFYTLIAEGFPYDRLDNLLFAAQYQANSKPTGDESTVRRFGVVYNGSYTYDNRFLADVSVRRDGSSQYGTDRRFGTFWSTGLGWNIHNERFFNNNRSVNRLKLRATYGTTGSLNIPAYGAQSRYNLGTSVNYYGELGATLASLANPFLGWQQVYKLNFGLDAAFMQDRLSLRADVYRENTTDAVTTITIAPSTGFTSFSENLGKLQNTGVELSARYQIINRQKDGILWSVNVNAFTNRNILKDLSNRLKASNEKLDTLNADQVVPNVLFQEGESINTIYAVRSLGVDPATGTEVYLTKDGKRTFTWNAADKVPVGINQPKWNGNFGSNLMLKGFEVNLIFNYQFGGQLYNQTLVDRVESVDPNFNVDRRAYDLGWSGPGDVSKFMRIRPSPTPTRLTSRFVQDENNLRLSSASVGYNFYRSALLKKLGLRSFQVTAITNDLFWLSSIQIERGTDNPFARTYSLTLRAGF